MFSPAKLTRPAFRPPLLLVLAISLLLGGCASGAGDSFTLQADLPANFKFTGDAYYVPAPGETCSVPERIGGRRPDRKFFESDYEAAAHRVEFQVPLRDKVRGCPLVLRSMRIELDAKWTDRKFGRNWRDTGGDVASLSFRDALPANYPGMPASGLRAVEGQCHWMFRTVGPQRYLIKLLKCQALEDGQLQKWKPGAVLQRDQLPGRTVRLVIGMSGEEEPYYGRSWLKTDAGWKPCLETKETIRCQAPPTFTDFKLPDGRTCTVYPTCTEQESRP